MEPEYKQIVHKDNYRLEAAVLDVLTLKLRVCALQNGMICRLLQGKINSDMLNKCSLTDFSDLQQYLSESPQNHQINWKDRQLKIMAMTNVRNKTSFIQLLKIELEDVEVKQTNNLFSAVALCKRSQDLSNPEIKQIFLTIIGQLNKVDTQSSNEVVDSIISKIGIVSQKTQYIQIRLSSQIEQIKQRVIENKRQFDIQVEKNEKQWKENKDLYLQLTNLMNSELEKIKKNFQFQSKQLFKELEENKKELKQRIIKCERKIEILSEQLKKEQEKTCKAILDLQKGISNQKIGQELKQKMQKLHPHPNSPVKSNGFNKLFTIPNQEKSKYKILDSKIERIGPDSQSSGIVGNHPITKLNKYKFKIIKTDAWGVSIGIKDVKNNEIIKYGGNGWISNCSNTIYSQGKGLNNGDTLNVIIDLDKNEIKWQVQNKQIKYYYETKCYNAKIANKDRQWFPFITVSIGDIVEIL